MALRASLLSLAALGALSLVGCGGPSVHAVRGQVVTEDGTTPPVVVKGHIEVESEKEPKLRASGVIGPDGRFELKSQLEGKIHPGVPEGKYIARVIPPQGGDDDDLPKPKKGSERVDPRFLTFQTSGLVVDVPAKEAVTLTIRTVKR